MVTITGTNLGGAAYVRFGSAVATGLKVLSPTSIQVTSPPGAPGTADVTVSSLGGVSAVSAADKFTYTNTNALAPKLTSINPAYGLAYVGGITTLSGTNFRGVKSVMFGSHKAAFFVAGNMIITVAPGTAAGKLPVTVTTAYGTSNALHYTEVYWGF